MISDDYGKPMYNSSLKHKNTYDNFVRGKITFNKKIHYEVMTQILAQTKFFEEGLIFGQKLGVGVEFDVEVVLKLIDGEYSKEELKEIEKIYQFRYMGGVKDASPKSKEKALFEAIDKTKKDFENKNFTTMDERSKFLASNNTAPINVQNILDDIKDKGKINDGPIIAGLGVVTFIFMLVIAEIISSVDAGKN